jgi:phosphoribosylaminoimidazole-succinocarboxamide synthase
MKVFIEHDASDGLSGIAKELAAELCASGFAAEPSSPGALDQPQDIRIHLTSGNAPAGNSRQRPVSVTGPETLLERTIRVLPLDFDSLPLLVEGESKIVRKWTDRLVAIRFKPTVYSYTANRYGEVPGTDWSRLKFTAALFRLMAATKFENDAVPRSAFIAQYETADGPLLIERMVETCNLEVRVKRYHIGSPLHRYRYTEKYPTRYGGSPLVRWSRLDSPVVCFDWRHPLFDEEQNRLPDEPLPDDYAALWIDDFTYAKQVAKQTFLWMERLFETADLRLIDMCIFIDRSGRTIYGEISPDCMRVRLDLNDPSRSEAADKDLWRGGHSPDALRTRYEQLYQRLFESKI